MRELIEGGLLAGRYTLVRRIGKGGMAQVWLADDRQSGSQVALKLAADPGVVGATDALNKEWRIGSRLMHANIIRVFEFHDDDGLGLYAMQYIAGPDISTLSRKDLTSILRPAGLIADALRYAHGKGLVHRDIKAANILLDARGNPYLMDFGVAARAGSVAPTGGSLIAASPQQQAGEPPAPADDIYSLGILLVELIAGEPPQADSALDGIVDSDGNPLPSAVQSLLREMVSSDSAVRPTAEQVSERLDAAGFPAGAAPGNVLGGNFAEAEPVVAATAIRPQKLQIDALKKASAAENAHTGGISPRTLYAGLAGMLLLFLAVIFLLPAAVEDDPDPATEAESGIAGTTQDETETQTGDDAPPAQAATDDDATGFSENVRRSARTAEQIKDATDEALGDLLSRLERLRYRGIERWGGQTYLTALDVYAEGDRAYVNKDFELAGDHYRRATAMLDPFFDRIDEEFAKAMDAGKQAFENGDHVNAVLDFDLAVAITPGHPEAVASLERAKNLKSVLDLVDQAIQFEGDLELDAARIAFEQALALDSAWEPAIAGLARVRDAISRFSFEQRMTEGLEALSMGDYASARAAFNAAKVIDPNSRQPVDGLIQVDQEVRLANIRRLDQQAQLLEENEEWETAIVVYEDILKIDGDLQFAKEGLARARDRDRINKRLNEFIDDPDALSSPRTMQAATNLLLELSRITPAGPRLNDQKTALGRLLKRAATPLDVMLVSDSATEVAVNRVARLGTFQSHKLSLKPGVYVAVGSRAGYRDVRIEFRVAPEIEMKPIVVQCEEQI